MKPITTYVREAIAENPGEEPSVIADAVLNALPPRQIRHYLKDLLEGRVKDHLRLDGNASRNAVFNPVRGGVTSSPKYAERRSLWQQMMDDRINISGAWKRFGECTRDELKLCIKERCEQIDQINNQINNIEHVITLLDNYDAATPDDLPEQKVA